MFLMVFELFLIIFMHFYDIFKYISIVDQNCENICYCHRLSSNKSQLLNIDHKSKDSVPDTDNPRPIISSQYLWLIMNCQALSPNP